MGPQISCWEIIQAKQKKSPSVHQKIPWEASKKNLCGANKNQLRGKTNPCGGFKKNSCGAKNISPAGLLEKNFLAGQKKNHLRGEHYGYIFTFKKRAFHIKWSHIYFFSSGTSKIRILVTYLGYIFGPPSLTQVHPDRRERNKKLQPDTDRTQMSYAVVLDEEKKIDKPVVVMYKTQF